MPCLSAKCFHRRKGGASKFAGIAFNKAGHGGRRSISFNHHIGASAISLSTAKGCSSSPRFGGKGLASPLCAVHFLTVPTVPANFLGLKTL